MNHRPRRFFAALLALALLLGLAVSAQAVEDRALRRPDRSESRTTRQNPPTSGTCGDGVTWSLSGDGVLTISGSGHMDTYEEYIYPWEDSLSRIRSLVIEPGVLSIPAAAFALCENLTSVSLPEGLASIGTQAFAWSGITSISLPASLVDFDAFSLDFTYLLDTIEIAPGNPDFTVRDGIVYSKDMTELVCCPKNRQVGHLTLPATVTTICDFALEGCAGLTGIELPKGLKTIGEWALAQTSISSVTLPAGLESILAYAFFGTGLTSVTLPASLTTLQQGAFSSCDLLTELLVEKGASYAVSVDGVLFSPDKASLLLYPEGKGPTYEVPAGTRTIGGGAFCDNYSLTDITFPEGLTAIGPSAFESCSELTSLRFPKSLTELGEQAFQWCFGLNSVSFQGSAPKIGQDCFSSVIAYATYPDGDSSWTEAMLQSYGGDLTWIREGSGGVYIAQGTCGDSLSWSLTPTGHLSITGSGRMQTSYGSAPWLEFSHRIRSVAIGEGVTTVGSSAFRGCYNLSSVELPKTLTTIGGSAFLDCTSLSQITLPTGLTQVEDSAFAYCGSLTDLHLPASLTTIGSGAFRSMYSLLQFTVDGANPAFCVRDGLLLSKDGKTLVQFPASREGTLTIPETVQTIRSYAFEAVPLSGVLLPEGLKTLEENAFLNCALQEVQIPATVEALEGAFAFCHQLSQITVSPDNPRYAARDGILYSKDLKTLILCPIQKTGDLTLPGGLTAMGEEAFTYTNLRRITLPSGLERIPWGAFSYSQSLEQVTIPASVREIDGEAFTDCAALKEVLFLGDAPVFGSQYAQDIFLGSTLTAYYPKGNPTWTSDVMQSYGGAVTWTARESTPSLNFTDLQPGAYYTVPVAWAVENGITSGTSDTTFSPSKTCMRCQVMVFLWRANGSPSPQKTESPFEDVLPGAYYYDAVLWAVEKGITAGISATRFGSTQEVTRAQFVTFLWKAMGSPDTTRANPFTDVPAGQYFTAPVLWALEAGITSGVSATQFGSKQPCSRGQVVTFLYQAYRR